MAQQTINVGAAPNDGTGTPLRTAFQYTNSNFTELYTAVGPSGNNIVVPGNATITGDLTVDTSTLKVDSANNRVGIGTATPLNAAHIQGIGQATVTPTVTGDGSALSLIDSAGLANSGGMVAFGATVANGNIGQVSIKSLLTNGSQNGTSDLAIFTRAATSDTTLAERFRISQGGICTWSNVGGVAGTAMTLNSTGLGVGRSPSYRLQASSGTKATTASLATVAGITTTDADDFGIYFRLKTDATGANRYASITSFDNGSGNGARDLVLQDLGGNVGIGVTPAGTGGCLQLKSGITFPATQVASSDANTLDDYEEGTWTGTLKGSVSDPTTPVTASGRYTKIGRKVFVEITFNNVNTTGASGGISVSGLPFACNGFTNGVGGVSTGGAGTYTGDPFVFLNVSTSNLELYANVSNNSANVMTHNASSGRYINISMTYTV